MPNKPISPKARAQKNGALCEILLKKLIPEIEITHEVVDGSYLGAPFEVKGCQAQTNRSDRNHTRSGRFKFNSDQHSTLLDGDGRYGLVVLDEKKVLHYKIVMASELLPEFIGEVTRSWTSVFKEVPA